MSVTNRETCRDSLATLLSAALVGTGLPVKVFYGYPAGDFGGQSPAVTLASAGSYRSKETIGSCDHAVLRFDIHVFVLYTDRSSWNEDDAEDQLDLIEKAIAEVILSSANQGGAKPWMLLDYAEGGTSIDWTTIGGNQYRYEIIPIRMVVES
jgi:hypothetical protein